MGAITTTRVVHDRGGSPSAHWTTRVHDVASLVATVGALNALILVFTLAGGVILGIAPALVASAHCVRERRLGRLGGLAKEFASVWRRELIRANIAILPLLGALVALGWSYLVFSVAGPDATPQRIMTLIALAFLAASAAWAVSICAAYDTPAARVGIVATRLVLANPFASLLQLVVIIALGHASSWFTGLPVFLAFGAWSYASTALALHAFAVNEGRRALVSSRPESIEHLSQ